MLFHKSPYLSSELHALLGTFSTLAIPRSLPAINTAQMNNVRNTSPLWRMLPLTYWLLRKILIDPAFYKHHIRHSGPDPESSKNQYRRASRATG